jgi:hypothetical protein
VWTVEVSAAGTLAVALGSGSASGTALFVLTDPCNASSCIGRATSGSPASVSVTSGTTYILVETQGSGGAWSFTATCP